MCGLLAEIRRSTYQAHRQRALTSGRVLFALDEAANIAPLEELPSIASEGGGQGLTLLAAFQDLSQARTRWGEAAEGFLTLFGTKLILPGIADPRTLESVSTALGEYDREVVARTRSRGSGLGGTVADLALGPSRSAPTPQRSTDRLHPANQSALRRRGRERPRRSRAAPRRARLGAADAHARASDRAVEDAHRRAGRRPMSECQSSSSRRQTGRTADVPDRSAAAEPALGGAPCAGAIESAGGDICGHLAVSTV